MLKDLPTNTSDEVATETEEEVLDTNLSPEDDELTFNTEDASESEAEDGQPESNEQDENDLAKRYKASTEEALKQKKRAEEAETLLQKQKDEAFIREDKSNIFKLAKDDYEKAQLLASEIYGKSLSQMESEVLAGDSLSEDEKNQIRITKGIRAALDEEKAKNELSQVRDLEETFFASKGLAAGSPAHAAAMNTYRQLTEGQNKTLKFVKNALNVVIKNFDHNADDAKGDINSANTNITARSYNEKPDSKTNNWEKRFEKPTHYLKSLYKNAGKKI